MHAWRWTMTNTFVNIPPPQCISSFLRNDFVAPKVQLVQVELYKPGMLISRCWLLVGCDVTRRPFLLLLYVVFVAWLCFGYVLSDFGYCHPLNHHHLIAATITTICTYNYHHKSPPRSASCSSTSALFAPVVGRKTLLTQVAEGDTAMCAIKVFAAVVEWKSRKSTSCNG